MAELIGLDKLPIEVKKRILPFMEGLLAIHTENIISIFIYGSAAGVNYLPKISDINSAFVFKRLEFAQLHSSLSTILKGMKQRMTAPLFLTKDHIRSTMDIFPIEFLEMKENHVVIYGEDIFSSLEIPLQHLRLFCEQQIQGKLIRIRQAYLEVGLDHKRMEALLKDSLNALIPVFRTLIRLKKKTPPLSKHKILEELCEEFQLDSNILKAIYRHTTQEERILRHKMDFFVGEYLKELGKLAALVDRI